MSVIYNTNRQTDTCTQHTDTHIFAVLGMESRFSHFLGKGFTTKLHQSITGRFIKSVERVSIVHNKKEAINC